MLNLFSIVLMIALSVFLLAFYDSIECFSVTLSFSHIKFPRVNHECAHGIVQQMPHY